MKQRYLSILAVIMLAVPAATFGESEMNMIDNISADSHMGNKHFSEMKETSKKSSGEKVADVKKYKRPIAKIAYPKKNLKPYAKIAVSKRHLKIKAKVADPKKYLKSGERVS